MLASSTRVTFAALACAVLLTPGVAGADAGSLYQGPGQRPGPDILYEPPADAPQLQNTAPWQATPILVSGASAYRDGEFLYQDYLYDDSGAIGSPVQNDPRFSGNGFSRPTGTYTYPTNTLYANNAADFVELRVKPQADATAFRITLNTIKDPAVVATTIAIGNSLLPVPWPHGANVSAPAQLFLTVHGSTAELLDAASLSPVGASPPTASVDMTRRQITVLVPHTSWDPAGQVVRLAAGVGLWNTTSNSYRPPTITPTATQGGGGTGLPNAPAFYNVAFRFNEPMPDVQSPTAVTDTAWWRENAQAHALTSGDISQFFANVDFSKLAAAVDDDMPGQPGGVPQTGPMDRILASHFETEQGAVFSGSTSGSGCSTTGCKGWYRGQLQPYAIYVPQTPMPFGGYGLTLLLHSLNANYNQFLASNNQSQFGERGPGSIVITGEGRGPDGWYYDYAGADTFEVWADVAAHFRLDSDWTAVAGYSMGGYGTYKFATQFPDLFAKAQPTVGPPGFGIWVPPSDPTPGGARSNTNRMLGSVRNIPFLIWNAAQDELVPVAGAQAQADSFDALGYRYEFDLFDPAEHLTLAINDAYQPAADFLGTTPVDRNPPHVTYAYNPTMDFPAVGTAAGHAYWVSGLTLRDASGSAPLGTIDVQSHGFGVGDPTPSGTVRGSGTLTGGQSPAIPYTSQAKTWGAAPSTPVANRLDIQATNMSTVTIDATRARVDCNAQLNVTSDGPLDVNLVNCPVEAPQTASPIDVSLVPVFKECGTGGNQANANHAPPLSPGACNPPQTVGTAHLGTQAVASAKLAVIPGDLSTPADEADVMITANATDVRAGNATGPDYDPSATGPDLTLTTRLRITDSYNGASQADSGTAADLDFSTPVECAASGETTIGATCTANTTADAVVPGSIAEGKRAVLQVFRVRLSDSGADGARGNSDDRLFAQQGVYVP